MELNLVFSIAIPAGIISGIMSPFFVSWLQHRFIWKRQRDIELRNSIFRDAVRALSMLERDALDPGLQTSKAQYNGISRTVDFRAATLELCLSTRSLIQSFFSLQAYSAFNKAYNTPISIEKCPDPTFDISRSEALVALSKEL